MTEKTPKLELVTPVEDEKTELSHIVKRDGSQVVFNSEKIMSAIRRAGEATEEFLLAPEWTSVKHCARNAIDAELKRRNSWQGKYYDPTWRDSESYA